MPYWSSSRVGAVPVGGSLTPSPRKSSNRRSLRKGITMEDLKKQTALRLAHEQGREVDATPATIPVVETPTQRRIYSHSGKTGGGSSFHQNRRTTTGTLTPDRPHQAPDYSKANTCDFDSVFRLGEYVTVASPPPISVYSPTLVDGGADFLRVPPAQTVSSSLSIDSVTEKASKAKLPHGLTVNELKEMTKARLVAEAVQRGDIPPLAETQESHLRISTDCRDSVIRGAPSPLPHGFGRVATRSPYPLDNGVEAWDNASVSTSASDYPGSESIYSVGLNGNASFSGDEGIPFSRSASYPSNTGANVNDWSSRDGMPSFIANSPPGYFDAGYAPARRRAATLSPRQGLSYVQEDQPVTSGQFQSFSPELSSGLQHQAHRHGSTRIRSIFVPEVLNFGHSRQVPGGYPSAGVIGENNGVIEANRPRALSAVSLPATSHTSDEFLVDNSRRTEVHRFNGMFGSVLEDAANPVPGLSDVFREPSSNLNKPASLMGFGSDISSIGLGSSVNGYGGDVIRMRAATSCDLIGIGDGLSMCSSTHVGDTRHRAATWGELSALDLFCGHDLSDDLASILKMSGAEHKDTSS